MLSVGFLGAPEFGGVSMKAVLSLVVVFLSCWCLAAAEDNVDTSPLAVEVVQTFENLKFHRPLLLTHAGDQTNRVFVGGQLGVVQVFANDDHVRDAKVFFDLTQKVLFKEAEIEQGFLGLTFHPKYGANGEFFVFYSTNEAPLTSVLSRFRVSRDDPDRADPNSEEELLRLERPFANHDGGTIIFGPDGLLYVALGDGGSGSDPHNNAQRLDTLLGKIIRIDVDHKSSGTPYTIPKDNPFTRRADARPEIWAFGLRNVWRMSFDRETGALWAGDVGQDLWEEIDIIQRGGNYGWKLREGMHPFGPDGSGPRRDLIDPVWEYSHEVGKSITGGHVYRGRQVPELAGAYVYGDFVAGKIWALFYDAKRQRVVANRAIESPKLPILSFGEDEAGEIYVLTEFGRIYRFRSAAK